MPDEQYPETVIPGAWETIGIHNDSWGYSKHDKNWKSAEELVYNLLKVVSKGGNFLLNVGPTGEGIMPLETTRIFDEVGEWMAINGEAVYNAGPTPLKKNVPWGFVTSKTEKLYLHVFDRPKNGKLVVPGVSFNLKKVRVLENGERLDATFVGNDLIIDLPANATNKIATVIEVDYEGAVEADNIPMVFQQHDNVLIAASATLEGGASMQTSVGWICLASGSMPNM